ncbi:MAG: rRNA methyltransferase [Deltaproteobacteria bacterium SG8_13]|nr:MAG: rRNA methyltransferase [Deltaproteobacteria bacterium SG8_13]
MSERMQLDHLAVVLCRPRYPENIGATARAMCNMGLGDLIVVAPENCDLTRVLKMATHAAAEVIEQMVIAPTLADALAPFNFVVGTTARLGKQRQVIESPALLADMLVPVSRKNRIAIVFGPEDRGLTNEDLRLCHWLVNIPTADFASLNLAQAVMIVCYELFRACRQQSEEHVPRLASRHELDGMYEEVKEILLRISFIQPDNPDYWMNPIRHFFTRMQLRAKEVSIIRGICRQIRWYSAKRYQDGCDSKEG